MVITLRLTQRDDLPQNVPKNDCTKWFDCDRMYADVLADPTEKEADRADILIETTDRFGGSRKKEITCS